MAVSIRLAGPDDASPIVRVYVDSWNSGFQSRMPSIEADLERIQRWRYDLSPGSPTQWWLAESTGDVVAGFVGIGPSRDPIDSTLVELDTIAVSPSHWHRGIGKRLMSVALEQMRNLRFRSGVLWTLNDYPLGERFYVATGWRRSECLREGGTQVRYDHDLL